MKNAPHNLSSRFVAVITVISFLFSMLLPSHSSYAQTSPAKFNLPASGTLVSLSQDFNPAVIKGLKVFPDNPFRFDFVMDTADSALEGDHLKQESERLIKYFLAALTVPEDDLWVNLSPYEADRIIPEAFGQTEMGRDLLAQDFILKQLTASLMYPEDELGEKFWDRVYEKAHAEYGHTDIPVNTFNKVWIVPEKAVVYENAKTNTAFVMESRLKVMLEEDYEALNKNKINAESRATSGEDQLRGISTNIIREVIIPAIEHEVNEGTHFAKLRQIYHSMILATWFKRNLKQNLLNKMYVDQNKIPGVDIEDTQAKQKIYNKYLQAFKTGAYDYIKEEYDPATQQIIPKKYFSGGIQGLKFSDDAMIETAQNNIFDKDTLTHTKYVHIKGGLLSITPNKSKDKATLSSTVNKTNHNQPKISVIIPSYNMGKTLEKAINSVLRQTNKNTEIIIVDDGSKDNTADVMSRIIQAHPNIIYIKMKKNGGRSVALNHALNLFTGEYVAFLDADDTFPDDSLEVRLKDFQDNPDVDFIYTSSVNQTNGVTRSVKKVRSMESSRQLAIAALTELTTPTAVPTLMYKRAIFDKTNPQHIRFDPTVRRSQDYELLFQLAEKGYKSKSLDKITYNYSQDYHDLKTRLKNRLLTVKPHIKITLRYEKNFFRRIYYFLLIFRETALKLIWEAIFENNDFGLDKNAKNLDKSALTKKTGADLALLTTPGGIDLTPNNLDLQTQGQGGDFDFPFAEIPCLDDDTKGACERINIEELENMDINGLSPVIFQIIPMPNLHDFLGLANDNDTVS